MAVSNKLDWLKSATVKDGGEDPFAAYHLYTDIKLDIKQLTRRRPNLDNINESITSKDKDLQAIYDTECIIHSLNTLFNTPKGSRVLVPEYGTDLYHYIGTQITDLHCIAISENLKSDINKWEPRVVVTNLVVTPYEDGNEITIDLFLEIPEIRQKYRVPFNFDARTGNVTLAN